MKQGLLALAVLFGVAVSVTRADYVIILANVGHVKEPTAPMGQGGQAGVGGGFGAGGGQIGIPPIGQPGMPPIGMPPIGMPPIGAGGGGVGVPPIGGNMGGAPPAIPPIGVMGGAPPAIPPIGNIGGQPGAQPPATEKGPRIMAVVDIRVLQSRGQVYGKPLTYVEHPWGQSHVWLGDVQVETIKKNGQALIIPSVADRFRFDQRKLHQGRKPSAQQILDLAEWALTHGLVKEFEDTMKELGTLDKTHQAFVNYSKVKEALDRKINRTTAADQWLEKPNLRNFKKALGDFHVLLHRSSDTSPQVTSKLRLLRETFVAFYYWNALRGNVLPLPQDKLVCIMTPASADDFFKQNDILDGVPIVADSFFSPRLNLVVFAAQRLDAPYRDHARAAAFLWEAIGSNKEECLKKDYRSKNRVTSGQVFHAQTQALFLKALEEDVEAAAVTHSGTRQILVATGQLPRHVLVPNWVQFGMGSLMQAPLHSPWKNYGGIHWSHQMAFKTLSQKSSADKLLRSIVTDEQFHTLAARTPSTEAQASAWALTYFLAQKNLKGLQRYFQELTRLPRDLELDADVLLDTFARAMDCVDSGNRRDDGKLAELAESFISFFGNEVKLDHDYLPLLEAIHKLDNELVKEHAEASKPKPGGGSTPGGINPFPGAGGPYTPPSTGGPGIPPIAPPPTGPGGRPVGPPGSGGGIPPGIPIGPPTGPGGNPVAPPPMIPRGN